MKVINTILKVVVILLVIYLLIFSFWLITIMACLQFVDSNKLSDNECRQNTLTQVIMTTHKPLLILIQNGLDQFTITDNLK